MHSLLLRRDLLLVYEMITNASYFIGSEYRLKRVTHEIFPWEVKTKREKLIRLLFLKSDILY